MALVAYASSDSGCSDDEDDKEAANLTRSVEIVNKTVPLNDPTAISNGGANTLVSSADLTGDPHISDEEDIYPLPNSAGGQGLSLPAPKHSTQPQAENEVVFAEDEGRSHSGLLAGLPQPRSAGTRDGEKEDTMVEDELEDIVKPKAVELALQEKPPAKTRQPVKIVIPALQDGEREEDKEPSRKKMRPAPGKSGLLAFLPPPQQTITKETNRLLIPHTLSKKPTTASTHKPTTTPTRKPAQTLPSRASPSTKVTSLLPGINAAEDSEDDEDEENPSPCFFSFGDSRKAAPVNSRVSVDVVQPVGAIAGPALRPQGSGPALRPQRSESQNESKTNQADAPLEFRDLADAPLQFSQTRPSYPASHYGPSTANAWSQSREAAQPYQFSDNQSEAVACPDSQGSDAALQIESDQLLRLQGRRRHGREEIHIIDVHGDDQRSEVEVTRNLTEEQNECHSRKKKDMPTRQQKSKHQITYLAYKAKEREFDLKNQWAQNKMTRRQTQAKYGF